MFALNTHVLVIDDMAEMRRAIIKHLKQIGFTSCIEAEDGDGGWNHIKTGQPQVELILCDWNMPKCNGLELLQRVRSDKTIKSTPFIMITAESDAKQVAEAMKWGVDNYLIKPINLEMLKERLEKTHESLKKKLSG